jgi:hypothetical protein
LQALEGWIERQAVHELRGEGVRLIDAFVLEAFLVFTAPAQHGVAARVVRGAGQTRDQVRFTDGIAATENRFDLIRGDAVGILCLLRLISSAPRPTSGDLRDRAERLPQLR